LIVFVVIPVKSSLADWNWVPTGSMSPTILEGDLIYVDKLAYGLRLPLSLCRLARWSDPETGDIVICFSPEDGTRLVKRVIGKPGDIIELRNGRLFLNGRAVRYAPIEGQYRKYLSGQLKNGCTLAMEELDGFRHAVMSTVFRGAARNFGPVKAPEGYYFVMGDNRDNSRDSRIFVSVHAVLAKQAVVFINDGDGIPSK